MRNQASKIKNQKNRVKPGFLLYQIPLHLINEKKKAVIVMNKAFYIVVLWMLFCCEAKTQTNLVPNPGFEFYTQCPTGAFQHYEYPWYDPNNNTSDYFNICASGTDVGIPNNAFGYQPTHNGNGYCGFNGACGPLGLCAEYIATPLLQPLEAGKQYCVSFWLNLADSVCWANNMIGAYFDNDSITFTSGQLQVTPQIKFTQIITDRINWIYLQSSFIAGGGEKFMAISTFDSTGMDTITLCNNPLWSGSYYYIDDVSVTESNVNCNSVADTADVINSTVYPNVFTPNNDGINDVWKVNCLEPSSLIIINRWGTKIKEMYNKTLLWDGHTTSGEECVDGIYYYIIQNTQSIQKGFIQLLR
jgi:gliding motility-associated-like protein